MRPRLGGLLLGDLPEGWEDDWLGDSPHVLERLRCDTNRKLLEEAGFRLDNAEVRTQMDGHRSAFPLGRGTPQDDIHEVLALCARFGLAIPRAYRIYVTDVDP